MLYMSKTSKILKQAITDYIKLILFHVEDVEDVYNVYELQCRFEYKVFELHRTSNKVFELEQTSNK